MDIANCPRCGKLFTRFSDSLCEDCLKTEENLFETVREYVDEHPDCAMKDVAKATGATVKKIMKFLREGRLQISRGMKGDLRCEKCGKPISAGRLCDSCVIIVNQMASDIFANPQKRESLSYWRNTH
jgi:flagellar operon protein (TIGR03826 family)